MNAVADRRMVGVVTFKLNFLYQIRDYIGDSETTRQKFVGTRAIRFQISSNWGIAEILNHWSTTLTPMLSGRVGKLISDQFDAYSSRGVITVCRKTFIGVMFQNSTNDPLLNSKQLFEMDRTRVEPELFKVQMVCLTQLCNFYQRYMMRMNDDFDHIFTETMCTVNNGFIIRKPDSPLEVVIRPSEEAFNISHPNRLTDFRGFAELPVGDIEDNRVYDNGWGWLKAEGENEWFAGYDVSEWDNFVDGYYDNVMSKNRKGFRGRKVSNKWVKVCRTNVADFAKKEGMSEPPTA